MEIIVCLKRVPDLSDVEVVIDASGRAIRDDDVVYGLNEWDRFAVEEALRLKEAHGGRVIVMTVGDDDAEEVLRRGLAMGADEAVRLWDPAFVDLDAYLTARILAAGIMTRPFDLVLTGSVSSDSGAGVVGGMLAALLDIPQVALATAMEVSANTATVQHEVEGGLERVVEIDLPALVSVQTGMNEPRYVSIRGIRKVAGVEVPLMDRSELGLEDSGVGRAARWVTVMEIMPPDEGEGAEILEGPTEEVVEKLVERLKAEGGF